MNVEKNNYTDRGDPPLIMERPYVGLTPPDYGQLFKAIAQLVKAATRMVLIKVKRAAHLILRKIREFSIDGDNLHRRQLRLREEHYSQHWYHLRDR